MAVAGALIGGAIGAFGKKPKVPELPEINPSTIQQQTIAGNLGTLPEAMQLGSQVNLFNQQQLSKMQEMALPGGPGQITDTINSWLKGEIPADVAQATTRAAAGRAIAGGFSGSGLHGNLQLRDLGLQSFQLMQTGITAAERWLAQSTAPAFNVTSMFFTPQQRLGFAQQDRTERFNRDLLAAQVKAAPDPATAALGKEIDRFFNTWAQFGMGMLGGAMGGGGGMGGAGGGQMLDAPQGFGGGNMGMASSGGGGFNNWLMTQSNAGSANGATV